MTDRRPAALFVAPVMPALTGNGLAMRAAMTLDALAAAFAVHLMVVPVSGGTTLVSEFVRSRTASVTVEMPTAEDDPLAGLAPAKMAALAMASPKPMACRFATPAFLARIAARHAGRRFGLVHVMRLYMAPYAAGFLGGPAVLDLDDDEARTRERIAALLAARGDAGAARLEAREAERYASLLQAWEGRFDRVLVCSQADRQRLAARIDGSRLAVVPNAVRLPPLAPARQPDGKQWLLFVGTLGYLPNADAASYLCREVLPLLRDRMGERVGVRIVGHGAGPEVLALSALEGVQLAGAVADLSTCYREADVVAVPVRAGGGTRIKLLEALAHARPVVATTIGAEGIELTDGLHLLVADTPTAFATACARLLADPVFAANLGANGRAKMAETYCYDLVIADLASLFTTVAPQSSGAR